VYGSGFVSFRPCEIPCFREEERRKKESNILCGRTMVIFEEQTEEINPGVGGGLFLMFLLKHERQVFQRKIELNEEFKNVTFTNTVKSTV
jgi:hypothetical protein